MSKFYKIIIQASGFLLLAFFCSNFALGQKVISLSGANSPQDDMNPVWIGDNVLLFTRAFHPSNLGGVEDAGDIWMTKKSEDGIWQEAVHRADLSSEGYDFALGLEDVLTLLVYHHEESKVGIYQYSKFGTDWNFLRQIAMPELENLKGELTGRVANGGKLIFLSGKSSNSLGNEDIYISEKEGPISWTIPQNLGATINTTGQEMSPFYDVESQQLYFSSNMHANSNGKDIFVSKRMGEGWNSWSIPEKWEQLSSPGSDVSVTFVSKNEVVWTSTQNSDGFADLLTFEEEVSLDLPTEFSEPISEAEKSIMPEPSEGKLDLEPIFPNSSIGIPEVRLSDKKAEEVTEPVAAETVKEESIEWIVLDSKTNARIDYSIEIEGSEQISQSGVAKEATISELKTLRVADVKFKAKGYFPAFFPVKNIREDEPTVVLMTKAESGNMIQLENVNFKRGTAELEGEKSLATLEELAVFLIENPEIKLRINGHTDNAGDPGLNKALSLDRAGSVRDFLVEKGVEFENIRISGWGGTRPVFSNATEVGRAKNRRVELEVIQ